MVRVLDSNYLTLVITAGIDKDKTDQPTRFYPEAKIISINSYAALPAHLA